jgi:hypothetical protein
MIACNGSAFRHLEKFWNWHAAPAGTLSTHTNRYFSMDEMQALISATNFEVVKFLPVLKRTSGLLMTHGTLWPLPAKCPVPGKVRS